MIKGIFFAVISVKKMFPAIAIFAPEAGKMASFAQIWPFLQVTTFWLQRVGQTYFLHTFRIEMYSLAHSLFNKSIVIKISRELA